MSFREFKNKYFEDWRDEMNRSMKNDPTFFAYVTGPIPLD